MTDRTLTSSSTAKRPGGPLRAWSLVSVIFLLGLIILGGVVRITDSGLGCPDWPFCYGKLIPPAESKALIEYFHRFVAAITGLIVVGTGVVIWRSNRSDKRLTTPIILAIILLVIQVILGWITVRTELNEWLVMAHLTVAQSLLAMMLVIAVIAWTGVGGRQAEEPEKVSKTAQNTFIAALVATFAVILSGAYTQATGATGACGDSWPLCSGTLFPDTFLEGVHMGHRLLTIAAVPIIVAAAHQAYNLRDRVPGLDRLAPLFVALFVGQIIVGGINVMIGFHRATNVMHLAAATFVWAALVLLVAVVYMGRKAETGEHHAA